MNQLGVACVVAVVLGSAPVAEAARIYYWTATGVIYGVHPTGTGVTVPAGVSFKDVPEAPDQIVWPSPDGGATPGAEQSSRINPGTQAIEVRAGWTKPAHTDLTQKLDAAIADPLTPETTKEVFRKLKTFIGPGTGARGR